MPHATGVWSWQLQFGSTTALHPLVSKKKAAKEAEETEADQSAEEEMDDEEQSEEEAEKESFYRSMFKDVLYESDNVFEIPNLLLDMQAGKVELPLSPWGANSRFLLTLSGLLIIGWKIKPNKAEIYIFPKLIHL